MNKNKINKTITVRGGGNIFIPKKIIDNEYPESGGNTPTPIPKEPDKYIVKVTNIQDFTVTGDYEGFGYYHNRFLTLRGKNLFYDSNIGESEGLVIAVLKTSVVNDPSNSRGIEGFGSNNNNPDSFISKSLERLEFWCDKKEGALRAIGSLKEGAEIETNFEYTEQELAPYIPIH